MRYINKVKYIHGVGLPTIFSYHNCGDKTCFIVRAMFAQYYFYYQYYTTYYIFFFMDILPFSCLPILEGDIVRIINYEYDKYFSIDAWRKSGGTCDTKVKVK